MATKIYCAAIDCEFYNDNGRCNAKTVCLSDHDIATVNEGRQRFQRCKTYQESARAKELAEQFMKFMREKGHA